MANFRTLASRESKTVNESNATRRDYFSDGKIVLLGLTDRTWVDKDKVTQMRYQLCFAEVTNSNDVVRLVRMPFFTMLKSRLGIKDIETGKVYNNSGATIDFVESQYRAHADLKADTIWYQHILPALQFSVLNVKRDVVRTKGSYGAYNAVVYDISSAKTTTGQPIKVDFASIRTQVESLAQAGGIRIIIDDDTVINSGAAPEPAPQTETKTENTDEVPF